MSGSPFWRPVLCGSIHSEFETILTLNKTKENNFMKKTALFITTAAIIAALYVVLTFLANSLGLASQAIQVRFSESLTILALFTPAAIPGLFIGCLLSNILIGSIIQDVIFGSLTTLAAAALTYIIGLAFRKLIQKAEAKKTKTGLGIAGTVLGSLPPIMGNMLVVPLVLIYAYGFTDPVSFLGFDFNSVTAIYWFYVVTVGIGELISCTVLGLLVSFLFRKTGLDLKIRIDK